MRSGTQADLARELGISRASVSQAFKRHNIQISVNGKFDLDYAAWLLREKQHKSKSKAQRSAKKQLPGLKNPRLKREVIRLLWPIWNEAIAATIQARAETSFEDERDYIDLEAYLFACMGLWAQFHEICDREFSPDLSDFPFKQPECIDFDFTEIPMLEQIEKILIMRFDDKTEPPANIDYSKMPLEELERLVLNNPD